MAPLLYRGRTGGPGAVRLFSLVTGGLVLGPVVPRFVRTRGGGGGTSVVSTRTPCGVLLLPVPGAHGSQRGGCGPAWAGVGLPLLGLRRVAPTRKPSWPGGVRVSKVAPFSSTRAPRACVQGFVCNVFL